MPQKSTMTLQGFEPLQRALKQAPELVREQSADAVKKSTFSTAQRMRALAPRRTGRLKGAIIPTSRGQFGKVLVGAEAFYWPFVEYGTERMQAKPFIRPAAEAEGPEYIERIRRIGVNLERSWPSGAASGKVL